ncbi:MAG: ribbon-helix-helix protein, CopG family [Gemmatimonadetes bacterium]|nr:ribbon-helix-helix protein, CopG family [Gemmatimonadota bacterium]
MGTIRISVRIDEALKATLDEYCRSQGILMNDFIQEAILDRLGELVNMEDLKAIRREPTRPLSEVLAELKLDGEI